MQALTNQAPPGEAVRSVPWDSASLRQEPAVSFFSIWQHQIQVLMQGSKQAWGMSVGNRWGHAQGVRRAPLAGSRDPGAGGVRGVAWGAGGTRGG